MTLYKRGDRVVRTRGNHLGRFATVMEDQTFGRTTLIEFEDGPANAYNFLGVRPRMGWRSSDGYMKLVAPLPTTPFDQAVRAYITSELNNG